MQSRQERFGEPLQARPISRHVAGRNKIESLRSIDHEHIFVGRYRASARLPFWFRAEASQKAKKYGANAPQLRAIRCSIDFCVMLCNETAFNPVQTWFSDFAAMCRSTTVGMASGNKYELHQIFGSKPRWTPWSDQELQHLLASNEWEDMA